MNQNYTDTLYYHIRLTARYLKLLSTQLFEKIEADISFDEFVSLDILKKSGPMCQRDLAKLLLKDRANTSRIVKNLEKKNCIEILVDSKDVRLKKKLLLTDKGKDCLDYLTKKLKPIVEKIESQCDKEFEHKIVNSLQVCQNKIKQLIELQI